ncbi:restriction endonuclease subunit S [Acinetobacter baumannii]|uniref:restriction endonuclease subunit S n=1 Tax=Acinetobacter baumannii TaxID=470 RepID=UPI0019149235|nr:restriction endonuclease subunit S [Acinetobacter baumannii]MBK5979097.1 restriction endonuclease subunit S [Acinetobacter baumannii]MCZ3110543.1 restriction endonuclease subunit S [Acinetobacter baumannii]
MAAPKLRFKEFDGDWSAQKYKDALTIKYGKDHKLLEDGEIPVYGTGGVMRYVNQYLYDGESILIGRKGTIDQPKYVNEKFWTVDTLFYSEIKQNIYPLFIYQHALQVNWLGLNEATGVPSLNTTSINNVDIYLPSKEEQTKIASFLCAVDEKISQLTQKHALLTQYKQGMMQKLFSQQIRFKADDGSEFGEWGKAKVGNITETIFGYPFDSKEMVEDNNGIPLMRGINIGECHIRHSFELDRFFLKDTSKLEKYFVRVNDIVLSMDGSKVGRNSAFVTEKDAGSLLVQRVCILREKENTNIQYVYQWIISKEFHRYVDQVKTSSGIPHISGKQIQDYEISYPCLEEQTKIANFLSAIDQKIEVVTQQIEQAKTWKKGLLQQMFV